MQESIAEVVDHIVANIGRAVGNGRAAAAMMSKQSVMDGDASTIGSADQTVIVLTFRVPGDERLFHRAPLDRHILCTKNVDRFVRRPSTRDVIQNHSFVF